MLIVLFFWCGIMSYRKRQWTLNLISIRVLFLETEPGTIKKWTILIHLVFFASLIRGLWFMKRVWKFEGIGIRLSGSLAVTGKCSKGIIQEGKAFGMSSLILNVLEVECKFTAWHLILAFWLLTFWSSSDLATFRSHTLLVFQTYAHVESGTFHFL